MKEMKQTPASFASNGGTRTGALATSSSRLSNGRQLLWTIVHAPEGRDAELACATLRRADIPCIAAATLNELFDRLDSPDTGPVLVVDDAIVEREEALCARLRKQPPWSDLPVILLARRSGVRPTARALADRRNTTVLIRPLRTRTLLSVVCSGLVDRGRQLAVRDLLTDLERTRRMAEERAAQLQRLAIELGKAEERERWRLADLLHDDLQQLLVGARFQLTVVARRSRENEELAQSLAQTIAILDESIASARGLSHQLSPPPLRLQGLLPALQWLGEQMAQLHGLIVDVREEREAVEPEDQDLKTFAYRTVQELLLNVAKHSGVERAAVAMGIDADRLEITVSDEGRGFSPENLRRPGKELQGVGLISILERAELFGGNLAIESAPGRGSSFVLRLPLRRATPNASDSERLAPDPAAAAPTAPTVSTKRKRGSAKRTSKRCKTILIADDHTAVRDSLRALFSAESDLDVVGEAADGREAVELASRLRPDVVVMDVTMPELDGIEATRSIKSRHPSIRIIGLSMFDREGIAKSMLAAGAEAYLSKADSSRSLVTAVRGEGERR
jgi:signal transduction histidine kinase/ActR/RegA family two-component response regulator